MTATGKKIELASYAKSQGKRNTLLVFFRTGTCGICVHQLEDFASNYDQIQAANAAVLALSLDESIVQTQTSEKLQNKFPLVLDPDAKVTRLFDVLNPQDKLARPSLFLLGPDRKVLFHYVGQAIQDRLPLAKVMEILQHYSGKLPVQSAPGAAGG